MSTAETARTWLFVPGDRPERFAKAAAAGPDVVVLDLEDAVAPAHKDAARAHVTAWLARTEVTAAVRVNAAGSPWHDADIAALAALGRPTTVMLPKADSAEAIAAVLDALPTGSAVVALVETALGVARAIDLATSPGVVRLAFGSFDLAAELGVDPDHAPALAPARGSLVLASAVGGLAGPVDGVTGDVRDHERLTADVAAAAALGFAGKLCIHPGQVAPAAAALAPTADEVAWAERVLAAATEDGVALVDGRMVDAPVVARARRIVSLTRPTPGAAR
ncbi:HpcH/HpaI aldolase/citrate lyase family protein [Nocardioides luteus]|uniref:CoA ester lyase n=1 Tax=Nocardioides luteus TaxID=1844 RepID=A0A1J4N5F7_9ACTN|nr:CoA ester lyase [Nocardioides luteus]OIJ25641.1 CoA ester lyase [Nocardioides luteus]